MTKKKNLSVKENVNYVIYSIYRKRAILALILIQKMAFYYTEEKNGET